MEEGIEKGERSGDVLRTDYCVSDTDMRICGPKKTHFFGPFRHERQHFEQSRQVEIVDDESMSCEVVNCYS